MSTDVPQECRRASPTARSGADGRWAEAATGAGETHALAENAAQPDLAAWPNATLAVLAALRGNAQRAVRHLTHVDAVATTTSLGITTDLVTDLARWARGLLGASVPAVALQSLEQIRVEAAVRR